MSVKCNYTCSVCKRSMCNKKVWSSAMVLMPGGKMYNLIQISIYVKTGDVKKLQ